MKPVPIFRNHIQRTPCTARHCLAGTQKPIQVPPCRDTQRQLPRAARGWKPTQAGTVARTSNRSRDDDHVGDEVRRSGAQTHNWVAPLRASDIAANYLLSVHHHLSGRNSQSDRAAAGTMTSLTMSVQTPGTGAVQVLPVSPNMHLRGLSISESITRRPVL